MHCTVDDHRRHCCRHVKKKAGTPNSDRRARTDSCIRQCGPSTTARLCLLHQHTGNNPSLALQLYAEQMSQSSFSAKRIKKQEGENRSGTRSFVSSALQLLSGRLSKPPPNIKLIKYADDITIYTSESEVADLINCLNIYLSQVLNYISNKKLTVSKAKSTVTIFTPDTLKHHKHPQVKLDDRVLPLEKKPKVLGVTLYTNLIYTTLQQYRSNAIMC